VEAVVSKEFVEEVKRYWRQLWRERVDDKLRAEGIACVDYPILFVDRGTVIFATRDFKLLSLKEILEAHGVVEAEKFVPPSPYVGGWGKFIKTSILGGKRRSKRGSGLRQRFACEPERQQLKKGGRGWLHL